MPIQIPHLHLHHHHRHAQPPPPPPQSHHPKSNLSESGTGKLLCLLLKCIIMTFILSLFLLFIGFAALVLLHFLLLTTTTSAGRRRRRRGQRQAQQYYSFSDQHVSPYSLKDVEDFVPSLSYDASGESVKDCAICLESFKGGENCRKLPGCNHLFHVICVDNWLVKVPNCPVCRNRVKLDSGRVDSIDREDDWRVWWPVGG